MPRTILVALVISFSMASIALAGDEQTVISIEGDTLPKVKANDLLRLTASGPSGRTEISATIDGPAKLVSTTNVRKFVNGRPLIGAITKEFLIQAEKSGAATVTITSTDVVDKKTNKKQYKLEIE